MTKRPDQQDIQKTALRVPRELHTKIHEAADSSGRTMNAEIVHRLESSFGGTVVPDGLPSAAEARALAQQARQELKTTVRNYVLGEIRDAIGRGANTTTIDFGDYIDVDDVELDDSNELFAEIIRPVLQELTAAGYHCRHLDVLSYTVDF